MLSVVPKCFLDGWAERSDATSPPRSSPKSMTNSVFTSERCFVPSNGALPLRGLRSFRGMVYLKVSGGSVHLAPLSLGLLASGVLGALRSLDP